MMYIWGGCIILIIGIMLVALLTGLGILVEQIITELFNQNNRPFANGVKRDLDRFANGVKRGWALLLRPWELLRCLGGITAMAFNSLLSIDRD